MKRSDLILVVCLCWLTGAPVLFAAGPAGPMTPALPGTAPEPEWMGGCSGFSVTAVVSPANSGSTVIEDLTNASCNGGPRYPAGHEICIEALPAAGYDFYNWTGAYCPCNGFPGPPDYPPLYNCCFSMPSSLVYCTANFVVD